jgi:hypothetical protein
MASVRKIVTPLLAAAAVSILAGCRPKEMQRCVDEHDNVVDDKLCANLPQNAVQQRPDGHGGFFPLILPYRYYYGGGGGYRAGSRVFGGGYQPQPGRDYHNATGSRYSGGGGFFRGITRGGFGSHFGGGGE